MALRIRRHRPGDLVQIRFDDGDHTLRGTVVAAQKTSRGMSIRLVSIPGYDGLLAKVPASRLSPADPFTPVPVDSLNRTAATPAQAQQLLADLAVAVRDAELLRQPPDQALLRDQKRLAQALGAWSGSGTEQVLACAQPPDPETSEDSESLTAAQLAAESFPNGHDPTVPGPAAQPGRTVRPGTSPRPRRQ